jgi:hypothetical protein
MMIHMTCRYWRGGVLVVPHGPPDSCAGVAVGVAVGVGVGVGLDEGEGVVRVPPG